MDYIKKFMGDNNLKIGDRFKIKGLGNDIYGFNDDIYSFDKDNRLLNEENGYIYTYSEVTYHDVLLLRLLYKKAEVQKLKICL